MLRRLCLLLVIASVYSFGAPKARIKIDTERTAGEVDANLFGNFAEHLGRCIYGGIFEEGSPLSDADGYRKDVMEATRQLGEYHDKILQHQHGDQRRQSEIRTAHPQGRPGNEYAAEASDDRGGSERRPRIEIKACRQ